MKTSHSNFSLNRSAHQCEHREMNKKNIVEKGKIRAIGGGGGRKGYEGRETGWERGRKGDRGRGGKPEKYPPGQVCLGTLFHLSASTGRPP